MRTAWASSLKPLGACLLAVMLCAGLALPAHALTSNTRFTSAVPVTKETAYRGVFEGGAEAHTGLFGWDNPVDNTDPTGLYTQQFGYLAHDAIEQIYAEDHPGDVLLPFGSPTGLGGALNPLSRLKPDIFNVTKKRWAEIKPLSQSGIVKGAIQYAAYNGFDLFGYYPDVGWQPSTHETFAGSDPIVFFNAGGVIFYTDAVSNLKDLLTLTTIQAVRQYYLANQAVIARGLIQSLARARTLASLVAPAAEADVGVGVATATETAVMGMP